MCELLRNRKNPGGAHLAIKDAKKRELDAMARELVRIIQAYPPLTDDQRRELKITVRKSRTPVPAPTARPMVEVASVVVRTVTVNVYDPTSATKRNKPAGSVGAKLYTFVGANYPSDPGLWDYQGDFTKSKCEITFADSVPSGAQVWVCAAWYNRKGETGQPSVPITTNIQGGGASEDTPGMKIAA